MPNNKSDDRDWKLYDEYCLDGGHIIRVDQTVKSTGFVASVYKCAICGVTRILYRFHNGDESVPTSKRSV